MQLNDILAQVIEKRKKVQKELRSLTNGLHIQDIIKKVDFSPMLYEYGDHEKGQPFEFLIYGDQAEVFLSPERLTRSGSGLEIASFTGEDVETQYFHFYNSVQEEKAKPDYYIPF